jgi:hypothetical protein
VISGDGNCATGGDSVVILIDEEQNGELQRTVTLEAETVKNVACGSAIPVKATAGMDDQKPTPLISGCSFCALS